MSDLIKRLTAERKAANQQFSRNDPYGRGFKRGIDIALMHAKGIRDGLPYDDEAGVYCGAGDTQ